MYIYTFVFKSVKVFFVCLIIGEYPIQFHLKSFSFFQIEDIVFLTVFLQQIFKFMVPAPVSYLYQNYSFLKWER